MDRAQPKVACPQCYPFTSYIQKKVPKVPKVPSSESTKSTESAESTASTESTEVTERREDPESWRFRNAYSLVDCSNAQQFLLIGVALE